MYLDMIINASCDVTYYLYKIRDLFAASSASLRRPKDFRG
jgi:hypothetical protein